MNSTNAPSSQDLHAQRSLAVFENALDGMIVISEQGLIESFNPAAQGIFGYSPTEVIGKNVNILMPEPFHSAHDVYLNNYMQSGVRRIIGIGREVIGRRKDGEEFPLDLAVSEFKLSGQRLFLGIVRDITERKSAERDLIRSRENLKAAQRIAHLGSWNWEIESGRLSWSDEIYQIFGLDPDKFEATYENFINAIHPDDREAVQGAVSASVESKAPYSLEHRVVRPDGEIRVVHEQGEVELDEAGNAFCMNGSVLDITELKEAERLKSEFVSTVSHELRTPLTAIHGSLALLVSGAMGELDEKQKKLVEVAHSSSDRLIRLINDLLDSEKLGSGKMKLEIRAYDIDPLIEQSISLNKSYAEKFKVSVVRKGDASRARVAVDQDRFAQVMTNLISNACKFSHNNGEVEVSTQLLDGKVQVNIADNGIGIAKEFQGKLFQQFSQADASDHRQTDGTGLGLSICKAIVKQMGGEIGFVSEEGKGSTFFVQFPVLDTEVG